MRINNNIMAMNSHRNYSINNTNVSKSIAKLSSGYRINSAADDAAGLAISEKMRAQIRGLQMASKNSQDGISMVQTAEGALQTTHDILQRMRELSVQSASDTNETTIDRAALQQEFAQLKTEIDDIANKTRFNDQNLIDGTFQKYTSSLSATTITGAKSISVTNAKAGQYTMTTSAVAATAASVTAAGDPVTAKNTSTAVSANNAYATGFMAGAEVKFAGQNTAAHNGNIYRIDVTGDDISNMTFRLLDSNNQVVSTAIVDVSSFTEASETAINFSGVGKLEVKLGTGKNTTGATSEDVKGAFNGKTLELNTDGKNPTVKDAVKGSLNLTIGGETVTLYKGDTVANFKDAGIVLNFDALSDAQIASDTTFGAASTTIDVAQTRGMEFIIQTGANQYDELSINIDAMNTASLGISFSDISDRASASKAITEVNDALNQVSTQRAELGALQNRMEYKIQNLDISAENLTSAESRIRDLDMAKEMTNFTRNNILSQASTAMLAQANSLPQGVLQLLG